MHLLVSYKAGNTWSAEQQLVSHGTVSSIQWR